MSQFTLNMPNGATALTGYDKILNETFLTVYNDGQVVYTSLGDSKEDPLWLEKRLCQYGIVLPKDVYRHLAIAQISWLRSLIYNNVSEEFTVEPTPLQQQLSKMHALQLVEAIDPMDDTMPEIWILASEREDLEGDDFVNFVTKNERIGIPASLLTACHEHIGKPMISDEIMINILRSIEPIWEAYKPTFS